MQGTRRWPAQATPVVEEAVRLFADLRREGSGKHDDRRHR